MLLIGGGRLDAWQKGEAPSFRELYGFDPKAETVEKLADGPTAFYESQLAYDSKHELFVTVAVFNKKEQPSGMFGYDPKKNAWHEIKPANAIPRAQQLARLDEVVLRCRSRLFHRHDPRQGFRVPLRSCQS